MALLRDVDEIPPKKPTGIYALITVVLIAGVTYMFLFRTSTDLDPGTMTEAPTATAPGDVPESSALPTDSAPPSSEPDPAEPLLPTEEPVGEVEPDQVTVPPAVVLQVVAEVDGAVLGYLLVLQEVLLAALGDDAAAERPGLCIFASEDSYTGGELLHRQAAERAGAQLSVLDGLGHWWMCEDPIRGAELLGSWFDNQD